MGILARVGLVLIKQTKTEEGRNRITIILGVPILVVIIVVSLVGSLITTPINKIKEFIGFEIESDLDLANEIIVFKENEDIIKWFNENNSGSNNENNGENNNEGGNIETGGGEIVLKPGELKYPEDGMQIPLYLQYDKKWGSIKFGGGNIASSGCSITSLAMVVSYLNNKVVTPKQVVDFTGATRYYVEGIGGSWNIFPDVAAHYGISSQNLGMNKELVINALKKGEPVISSMKPGTFTKAGHFIVLRGISPDGKILVNDPNDSTSKNFINKSFEINLIMREAKNFWSFR